MFGVGSSELVIIAALAVLLFGAPALIAFWLGYRAGSKNAAEPDHVNEPAQGQTAADDAATEEERLDE